MPKKIKWVITTLILIVAVGMGVYNLLRDKSPEPEPNPGRTPSGTSKSNILNVNSWVVKEQALNDVIFTTGNLMPDEEVSLSFETSGKIVQINFSEGTAVRKGDLLAKVNDQPLLAQLSKYQVQLKLAEDRLYRQSALLEKDAVSQEAYEQARTELATLHADMDLVKANINLTELHAPFDGIIGLRNVSEGAYASPSVVVAKLTKVSPLKIEFSVPERYATDVHKGTRLTFNVDGDLNTYDATVYAVESSVNLDMRTLTVRALYPNDRLRLMPGRFANVQIRMREIPNAIAIPTESLVPEMGVDKVFLYKDGVAQPVEIKTGIRTDALVQVVSGLRVGDTLITSGTLQLRTGLKVKLDVVH